MFVKVWTFFKHPWVKASLSVVTVFISGMLSKAVLNEITTPVVNGKEVKNIVCWSSMIGHWEFWVLIGYLFLYGVYLIATTKAEIKFREEFDNTYFTALVENGAVSELAKQIQIAIQNDDTTRLNNLIEMRKNLREGL